MTDLVSLHPPRDTPQGATIARNVASVLKVARCRFVDHFSLWCGVGPDIRGQMVAGLPQSTGPEAA